MTRLLVAMLCASLLVACASAPAPRDAAAKDRNDIGKPGAVFSHIEIGGGN